MHDVTMRITLTIDPEIADRLKQEAADLLIYVHNDRAPCRHKAKAWWEDLMHGKTPVGRNLDLLHPFFLPQNLDDPPVAD